MCVRNRGEHGRWAKGESGNPAGRKPLSPVAKLVEAAERAGASIVITVPPRGFLKEGDGLVYDDDPPPVPPEAA